MDFNESLTLKLMLSLVEVVTGIECYIKGRVNNAKKKVCDVKERIHNVEGSHIKGRACVAVKVAHAKARVLSFLTTPLPKSVT